MGIKGIGSYIEEELPNENNNNNNNNISQDSHSEIKSNSIPVASKWVQIAPQIIHNVKDTNEAIKASKEEEGNQTTEELRKILIKASVNIDTVFGYNFEHHSELNHEEKQILHPYMTAGSSAFGGSLASLLHGRIKLPRVQSEAEGKSENDKSKWLIFSDGLGLYCIDLKQLHAKDNPWGILQGATYEVINQKLKELNIDRYGWASDDKKERLFPHAYVTYVDAMLASLFSLPFYLLPAPYNLFGFMFTIGIFFYRLHPQLESIYYQKYRKGCRPSIAESDIIWRDALAVGLQTGLAATVTTFMMNIELHEAIGFNMSDAFSCVMPNILPACAVLSLSLVTGFALGAALVGIAKATQSKDNQYTHAQLARVFAAGFIAGALIYPFLMASTSTSQPLMCTLFLEYVISLSLGSALHLNVKNRLDVAPKKTLITSDIHKPAQVLDIQKLDPAGVVPAQQPMLASHKLN